jgi:pSer/pThr/pTyr-binding forkhead associated (FHA) protein
MSPSLQVLDFRSFLGEMNMASLIITTGAQKGNFYPLGKRTTVVGRDEGLLVQILDNKVSRKHMQVRFENDKYYVNDMNSKHGVFINNRRIDEQTELREHDYITLGETILLFTFKDFDSIESALSHYKKVGERRKRTYESTNWNDYHST